MENAIISPAKAPAVLLEAQSDLTALPVIPGAAVVGWGFDIFGRYAEDSKLRQLFDLGPMQEQQVYGRDFDVPAGVGVDSGSTFHGKSYFFKSRDEYQATLSNKAEVKGSSGAFSADFSANYSSVGKEETEYQYLVFDASVTTWGLSLREPAPENLLPSVTSDPDFQALPAAYIRPQDGDPGNGQLFFRFFQKFGTHFVAMAQMGGSLVYYGYLNKSYQYDEETAKAHAKLEYKAVFLDTKAEATVDWKEVGQKWTEERSVSVEGVGGTKPLIISDPAYGTNVNDQFQAWLDSVPDNPKAVGFTLRPISQIFSGDQAQAVEQAYQDYANSRVYMDSLYLQGSQPTPQLLVSGVPAPYLPDSQDAGSTYWAVVLDRATLEVVFNRAFVCTTELYHSYAEYFAAIFAQLKPYSNREHILALTTSNLDVLAAPQGDLYGLLLSCGGGGQLKQIEEWALKQDSVLHGRITYCLLGVMGEGPESGIEAMASLSAGSSEKVLSCELFRPLLPETDTGGEIVWTPEA